MLRIEQEDAIRLFLAKLAKQTIADIRLNLQTGNLAELNKKTIKEKVEQEALKNGMKIEFTGDNWRWSGADDTGEPLMPQISASIALTQRNASDNIVRTVIAAVQEWGFDALVADETGCCLYKNGRLWLVNAVNPIYLDLPIELQRGIEAEFDVFGRKSTPHWVQMDYIIGRLNKMGIPTMNDMGPFYPLMVWFAWAELNKEDGTATIKPRNIAVSEPFCNKQKEEIVAFIIWALNQLLPEDQKFILTDMSGQELFVAGHIKKAEGPEACEENYCASGFLVSPTRQCHNVILAALKEAIEFNRKAIKLAQDLERVEIKPRIKNNC